MNEEFIVTTLMEIKKELAEVATDAKATKKLIVDNGYGKAVEDNVQALQEFKNVFTHYVDTRAETCPMSRRKTDQKRRQFDQRTIIIAIIVAAAASIPSWIQLLWA